MDTSKIVAVVNGYEITRDQLAKECIELRDVNALSGSMKRLAQWSDQDRHVNIMLLTPGLFNDEGQKLMSGPWLQLNRQLSVLLDRSIRGALFGSCHFLLFFLEFLLQIGQLVNQDQLM